MKGTLLRSGSALSPTGMAAMSCWSQRSPKKHFPLRAPEWGHCSCCLLVGSQIAWAEPACWTGGVSSPPSTAGSKAHVLAGMQAVGVGAGCCRLHLWCGLGWVLQGRAN